MTLIFYLISGLALLVATIVIGYQAMKYQKLSKKIPYVFSTVVIIVFALYALAGILFF